MNHCCVHHVWNNPREGDEAICLTCESRWVARTKPHVGEPTWWLDNGSDRA